MMLGEVVCSNGRDVFSCLLFRGVLGVQRAMNEEGGFMIGTDKQLGNYKYSGSGNQDPCLISMTIVCVVLLVRKMIV